MPNRINLAMWSGPRNLSTALMRSFANRKDVIYVMDEPFYASYLKETNKKHPLFKEIIQNHESNWKKVINQCLNQKGEGICFQKHMVHHILPTFKKNWMLKCVNFFLIREPKEVISSFLEKWPNANFEDFGFADQLNLFNYIYKRTAIAPIVIDASELQENPELCLKALCSSLNITWDSRMLEWEAGLKPYDGIWASHWYPSVKQSTRFHKKKLRKDFSNSVLNFSNQAEEIYAELLSYKIKL